MDGAGGRGGGRFPDLRGGEEAAANGDKPVGRGAAVFVAEDRVAGLQIPASNATVD